ncbi:PAS domain S-box protein [Halorientalis pallida]|uniref:histidine kinase n=1 Tax=Halorientalis pallida TaxID=2479928 RepID=A0A498KSB5_9EURY|nr:PAS domain S-box protein [Halorientalis pallida]RXK46686.1 PAS domain S-box protein [Halorientalis pallida]
MDERHRSGTDLSARPIRVLHVDDDPAFLDLAGEMLDRTDEPIDVTTETDPRAALDRLDASPFDCVVSDYDMPQMDGLEFLRRVREEHPQLPFVLFTGKGSEEIASEAISAGVTDYLQKGPREDQYALLANRIANSVEHHVAEREIDETRTRFSKLLEHSADYIFIIDVEGTLTYVTPSVERTLGYDPAEITGENAFDFLHPDDVERIRAELVDVLESPDTEKTVELRTKHRDGSWRWVEIRARNLLDDPCIEGIVGNVRDVTARKESEAELDWHRSVIRSMDEGVYVLDRDYRFRFINFRAAHTVDLSAQAWIGEHVSYLDEVGIFPDSAVADVQAAVDDIAAGERDEVRLVLEPTVPPSTEFLDLRIRPLETDDDDDDDTEFILATTRDITERKRNELDLERKNERLETFASVISHDLRNPLETVSTSLDLLDDSVESDHLDRSHRAVDRMERLIDEVLTLAREGRTIDDPSPVSLASVARDRWASIPTDDATLVVDTDAHVLADVGRLEQLLENLFRNAVEHGAGHRTESDDATEPADGAVTVRLASVAPGHGTEDGGPASDSDFGFVVEDDGPGIPPEQRDRVFEMGYSTTEDSPGLGLTIVDDIAQAHGWSVTVTESDTIPETDDEQPSSGGGARFVFDGVETV